MTHLGEDLPDLVDMTYLGEDLPKTFLTTPNLPAPRWA